MELIALKDIYKFESSFNPQNKGIHPDTKTRSSVHCHYMTNTNDKTSSKQCFIVMDWKMKTTYNVIFCNYFHCLSQATEGTDWQCLKYTEE